MKALHPVRSEAGIVWVLWLTYGSFYFCRTNIAAAVPGMENELGLSKTEIGLILGSLKIAYGIGQFINGQLAETVSPRKLLAVGMIGSALLNVLFGMGAGLYFLLFVWACNGYAQALGWTPCMKVAADWFHSNHRGRAIGIIGTGYQVTAALTYVISGFAAAKFGWRGALYIPAALLAASAAHMLFFLREKPPSPPHPPATPPGADQRKKTSHSPARRSSRQQIFSNITVTLGNPWLWFLAVSLGLLNACRYGFLDWGLTHLMEVQGGGVGKAALKYAVLPIGGIAGSLASGWATDRFFNGRRSPVIAALLIILGCLTLVYNRAVEQGLGFSIVLLLFIGFAVYGPQVLLVGTAPIDFARGGTAAAAVGFVNFMGYAGAFAGDQVTGFLVDEYDWQRALWFWAGCAFSAAICVIGLWIAESLSGNTQTNRTKT